MKTNSSSQYLMLPFNFMRFNEDLVLLVNLVGEYLFLPGIDFNKMVTHDLNRKSDLYLNLKSKHFIAETVSDPAIELLSVKYRTKKEFLSHFTSLHMFEITARCNQKCIYCQVSSKDPDKTNYDMNIETAQKAVDIVLMSPSKSIKIEFQGGEPLLNYEVVKYVIEYATKQASVRGKKVEFVVCTNLTMATDEMFKYFSDKNVVISTSLDGPKHIHDFCRRYRNRAGTYEDFAKSLERARKYIDPSKISALMTATRYSLNYPCEIVDEYIKNGFSSIFVRPLNPFGYSKDKIKEIGYTPPEFVRFYKQILDYVFKVNLKERYLEESFASLLLTRILTPFSTGFVDLQFPAGTGISGVMYGHDGKVYPSDESRMLANMGDFRFCMGDVNKNTYRELFFNSNILNIIENSCAESLPGCSDCAFQMYCGNDPVRNYATQNDIMGHRPTNDLCLINKGIIIHLFEIMLENDPNQMDIFWSWITGRSLSEVRLKD